MPSVYKDVVLLTIKEREWKDGKGFGVWIIQKLVDGKHKDVTLRAGMYSPNKVTGERQYPKDGLTDWDLEALKKQTGNVIPDGRGGTRPELLWDVATKLLDRKNPPPVPVDEPEQQQPAGPAEPELPPWMK